MESFNPSNLEFKSLNLASRWSNLLDMDIETAVSIILEISCSFGCSGLKVDSKVFLLIGLETWLLIKGGEALIMEVESLPFEIRKSV